MNSDRSFLFAGVCLQTGIIDPQQFATAYQLCLEQPDKVLAEVLIERGWLLPEDRPHLEHLTKRYLRKHGDDPRTAIEHLFADARQSLSGLESLATGSTIAYAPVPPGHPPASAPQPVTPTESRYTLTSLHATGGMGRVWLARDLQLDREVALKDLRPHAAGNSRTAARFMREARLTGQLEHPGIVPVYELTSRPGSNEPFYTMRFVRGGTLTAAIHAYHAKRLAGQAGPLELVGLLTAFVTVCNTVAYAHSRRVLHRDLKGDNVVLGDFGEVLVLDWGLAKHLDQAEEEQEPGSGIDENQDASLTVQGDIIGTPAYMAPEQAEGRLDQIDERTDAYCLGAMLYEILTGRPPFTGVNTLEVLKQAIRSNPPPPQELWPEAPPGLTEICLKAMAKDPANRYAKAAELAQAVQNWQEVQRRRAEDALRRQTEVLRSILNSMSEGVLVADVAGNVLHINPAAERMIGRQAASESGNEFYQPDQVTPFDAEDLPLTRAICGEEVNDVEMYIRPAAVTEGIWASANARPLRDESGVIRGGLVVFRDVTERKRAEADLLHSRERFELAVRGSQDGLWDWDPQTGKIYYSPRWKGIIGYEDHEIAHRIEEWEERLHPEDRERVLAANKAHLEQPMSHYECEYRLRHKNGSYRWILARGVALRDASGVAYRAAGSHVDITERKQVEEELARLLALNQESRDTVVALEGRAGEGAGEHNREG